MTQQQHYSVLLRESVQALVGSPSGIYIDGTFGRGGHSRAILQQLQPNGRLLAFDKDPDAITQGNALAASDSRFHIVHSSFADLKTPVEQQGWVGQVDGVLLDLGVSSPQLDQAERGFSFMHDGPLDMRMNPTAGQSAAAWLNSVKEAELVQVLFDYGEERFARRIARAIVAFRQHTPFSRTRQLAEVVAAANPKWERDKHPATRSFQAIRIFINCELSDLQAGLEQALSVLKPGGRLVVISFHSLEDRIVKRFFKEGARGENFPKGLPIPAHLMAPKLQLVGKSQKASGEEVEENIRSRSAVLRVAEKYAGAV